MIARRGAMELRDGMVINLGIGIPSGVGAVANEEGIAHTTLSLESGPIGGVPVAGRICRCGQSSEHYVSQRDL